MSGRVPALSTPARIPALWKTCCFLALLTAGAILLHGYHLGIEDQAIYLPGIEKNLHPGLFAKDSELFLPQTRATFLGEMVAFSVRATGVRLETAVFAWHVFSLFLFFAASWRLACRCFATQEARWGALTLLAALLTLPVAGTSLYLVDQYLHPRTLATALILLALVDVLDRRPLQAILWIALATPVHIQMAFYGVLICLFMAWKAPGGEQEVTSKEPAAAQSANALTFFLFPLKSLFEPASEAWKEAARTRTQHYLVRWEWYEWMGALAPLAFFYWFVHLARKSGMSVAAFVAQRAAAFQIFSVVSALVLTLPPKFERLTPYQPMRALHVTTLLFVLLAGGFMGQYVLQRSVARWLLLFLPLCFAMFYVQRQLFPSSEHVELPGRTSRNQWVQAFLWIKDNTPQGAYFALDPVFMGRPGEDQHGFRAFSERSMMADLMKDPGVVTLFPAIAARWQKEVHARDGWSSFTLADFNRLHDEFGVTWVVLEKPLRLPLQCPYQNGAVAVCRISE